VAKNDKQRKTFIISLVLNVIIMSAFLTLNNLTNPYNSDIQVTVIYFMVFSVTIIIANFLLYRYSKKIGFFGL
jgi:hypothetical protein